MSHRRALLLFLSLLIFACEAPSLGPEITGEAIAIDGDSLEIAGTRIRLFAVDAPEGSQDCKGADGRSWPCGRRARDALTRLVSSGPVTCRTIDIDTYARRVSRCKAGDVDVAEAMVRDGWAVAYSRFSKEYEDEQVAAQAAHRNLWAGTFQQPEAWRAQQRGEAPGSEPPGHDRPGREAQGREPQVAQTPSGCRIKGNVGSSGRKLYHVPGSRSYEETQIDPARGERWFCNEAEAIAAGWEAAG